MTRADTLALLQSKGMELVARIIDSENPQSALTRIEYDRQIGMLGSLLRSSGTET